MAADAASGLGDREFAARQTPSGSAPGRSAAFFDLDRTLMEGSSAFQFGRAAYRAGLLSRRQLIADGWANLMFRLRGASDEATHELRERISESLAGTRVRDLDRLGVDVLAGVLPRIYPQVLTLAYEHQDAGRRVYIVTAASQDLAEMLAHVLALDGAVGSQFSEVVDGVYTGPARRPVRLRSGEGAGHPAPGRARGPGPGRVLRVLRLRLGPADAATGRPPGRRQPRLRRWPRRPARSAGRCCASTASAAGSRPWRA